MEVNRGCFYVQCGFALLEVGTVQKKNTKNILLKVLCISDCSAGDFGALLPRIVIVKIACC